jgi:hypothetical protein
MPCAQNTSADPHFGQNFGENLPFFFRAEPSLARTGIGGYLFFLFIVFFRNRFLGSLGFFTRCTSVAKTLSPRITRPLAFNSFNFFPQIVVQRVRFELCVP